MYKVINGDDGLVTKKIIRNTDFLMNKINNHYLIS